MTARTSRKGLRRTMDWQKKMLEGMRLMQEACSDNGHWTKCHICPFDSYCTALMDAELIDSFEGLQDEKWISDSETD